MSMHGQRAVISTPRRNVSLSCDYPIAPVPFTDVQCKDTFWAPRIATNRRTTIPYCFRKCEETGRIANFEKAAGIQNDGRKSGLPFDDTDVYKSLEGAAFALGVKRDQNLETYLDSVIGKIAAAQEPDGYLFTDRTIDPAHPHEWSGSNRWEKESDLSHELYNAGHLYEAAVAYYQATGKRQLLDVAEKNAALLARVFGPGKITTWPGHQVVEMGLVKLYRATGKPDYLKLAKFFLDTRGPGGSEYGQAHVKVVDQREAVGHAVRATYMYAGMADVAALTGDQDYQTAIRAIWDDVVKRKLYVTGGIGARHSGEAFGDAYELPNMSAYCETCASIANVYWNHRLFLLSGESGYIDVLERTLYNALLSGVGLDGKSFFYPNPLFSMGQHSRSAWFGCSCCPSNVVRFISSLPGYAYAVKDDTAYVNLFAGGTADLTVADQAVRLVQTTDYPSGGTIDIAVKSKEPATFTLAIRIPGWARGVPVPGTLYRFLDAARDKYSIRINGKPIQVKLTRGYARLERTWKPGDRVAVVLPMPIRRVVAHRKVKDDAGRMALQRGPLVYCLEWPDNPGGNVANLMVADNSRLKLARGPKKLGGLPSITGTAMAAKVEADKTVKFTRQKFTAIPYHLWAHRGAGEMVVWIPRNQAVVRALPLPTIASTSTIRVSRDVRGTLALCDQLEPRDSNDHSMIYLHWWPNKGTQEWVEYRFKKTERISEVSVYWFDDGPWGGCRVPASWKLLVRDAKGKWVPVSSPGAFTCDKDRFNTVTFDPVMTKGARLEIQLPEDMSSGLLEWVVK